MVSGVQRTAGNLPGQMRADAAGTHRWSAPVSSRSRNQFELISAIISLASLSCRWKPNSVGLQVTLAVVSTSVFPVSGHSCWFLWSADGFHCGSDVQPSKEDSVKVLPLSSILVISVLFVLYGLFYVSSLGPFCSPSQEMVPHRLQTGHRDLTRVKCRCSVMLTSRLHPAGQAR